MPNKVEEAELIKAVTAKSTIRSSSSRSKTRITESSHDTNYQETDVDEADIMKSDGKHVFTAYGDILVLEVWDVKSGLEVSFTRLPRRNVLS